MVLAGLPSMRHFAHGHARLNAREILGRQHLAHPGQLAVGPQRDHVIDLAGGLAVVLKGAGTAWLLPDHFRGAEAVAHIGFGGNARLQLAQPLGDAPRCGQQGEGRQHGGGGTVNTIRKWHGIVPVKSSKRGSLHMSIFRRPDYQSDATQFINQLKATKPELDKQQQAGRALLWDKQVDRQLWNDYRQARVAQKPYVYQTNAD